MDYPPKKNLHINNFRGLQSNRTIEYLILPGTVKFLDFLIMMTSGLNSLTVILIFGALILLSFLTLSNPMKVNRKANFWFGIFLFLWSTFWLEEIVLLTFDTTLNPILDLLVRFAQYFTPIIFYFSVLFFTRPNYAFAKGDVKYLVLPLVYLGVLIAQLFTGQQNLNAYLLIATGLILAQTIYYPITAYLKIRKHQKKVVLFASNTNEIDLKWLEHIILLVLLISIIISVYNVVFSLSSLNVFINLVFVFVVFMFAYYTLKQKEIFPLDEKQRNEIISIDDEKQLLEMKRKIISDQELLAIKTRLNDLMQEHRPYLDSELNLIKLAELLQLTSHQLSYVINTGFNENFFQFINKYRVERAKELLASESMNTYSILGIAFESGFSSKTSFNTTFKKITHQTPSEFKKKSANL